MIFKVMLRMYFRMGCLVAVAIAWMGCRSTNLTEPASKSVSPPDHWSSASGRLPDTMTGAAFDELRCEELDGLIDAAFRQSPDLASMGARLQLAVANARIAGAEVLPSVGAGFAGSETKQNFIGLPIPGSGSDVLTTRFKSYGLNLNASWEVDLWGRLRAGKKAASHELRAAEQDYIYYRMSLAAQVSKAWAQVVAAQTQWELATETAENFSTTSELVKRRYLNGVKPSLEVRLALNSAENARALVQQRREQLEIATRLLQMLTGEFPDGQFHSVTKLPFPTGQVPAGLPSELLLRRPDLQAAEWRLKAADSRLYAARKALYPRLSLTGTAGTSTASMDDLLSSDFTVWSVASNVAQPLFQGGRLLAGIDLSKARIQEALAEYHSSLLRAFGEVETGLQSDHWLRKRHTSLQLAVDQSKAALRLAEDRYQQGVADIFAVLESQRRYLNDRTQIIEVRRLLFVNRVDLLLALGGGFEAADSPLSPLSSAPPVLSQN
jgi:multidrug efflux system outer membrane protein